MTAKTTEQLLEEELNRLNAGGDSSSDNQAKTEQKEGTETEPSPTYKVGNRELTPDQLYEEYKRLEAEFTRRSQRLSELEKSLAKPRQSEGEGQKQSTLSPQDQAVVEELRRLGFVPKDEVEKLFEERKKEWENEIITRAVRTSAARLELKEALDELEEDFDGSEVEINGVKVRKPKVEREKILEFIQNNPNTDLSPYEIARVVYHDDFVKFEARQLVGGTSSKVPASEEGGLGTPTPPPPRYSFNDGSVERALAEILKTK